MLFNKISSDIGCLFMQQPPSKGNGMGGGTPLRQLHPLPWRPDDPRRDAQPWVNVSVCVFGCLYLTAYYAWISNEVANVTQTCCMAMRHALFCRPTCHPQKPTKIYTFALRYAFNMRERIVGHGLVGWLAGWLSSWDSFSKCSKNWKTHQAHWALNGNRS